MGSAGPEVHTVPVSGMDRAEQPRNSGYGYSSRHCYGYYDSRSCSSSHCHGTRIPVVAVVGTTTIWGIPAVAFVVTTTVRAVPVVVVVVTSTALECLWS